MGLFKITGTGKSMPKVKGVSAEGTIRKISGLGKPIAGKLPLQVKRGLPRPERRKKVQQRPIIRVHAPQIPPIKRIDTEQVRERLAGATIRPTRRYWRETLKKPEGYIRVSLDSPPDLIEAFIDVQENVRSPYYLNRATEQGPDHDHEGECRHPRSASSFVSVIGLVVLKQGRLGIYTGFWRPVNSAIVYTFNDDDDAVSLYGEWRAAASKGKWLHRMVYNNPYTRVSS
jgi:hypothetical protein